MSVNEINMISPGKAMGCTSDYGDQVHEMEELPLARQNQKDAKTSNDESAPAQVEQHEVEKKQEADKDQCYVTFISTSSSSTLEMDAFEEVVEGVYRYKRFILLFPESKIYYLPYRLELVTALWGKSNYVKLPGIDFRIRISGVILERKNAEETRRIRSGFSFSDLKKSYTNGLEMSVLESIEENASIKRGRDEFELMLKTPVEFRAHTSSSFAWRAKRKPNKYIIVAVRYRKDPLCYHPDRIDEDTYSSFDKYERKARAERIMETLTHVSG